MSGHNKWSTIKHRKGAQDAKRGKVFTKVIKEITVAARLGGGDPESNPRLRTAMSWARSVNMPNDNVSKAIKKATGTANADQFESIIYEGYGPHNVAVIIECLTDNKNRTVSSVRAIFTKNSGNLGSTNSVQYMFDRVGLIEIEKTLIDEDTLTEYVLETSAEDIDSSGDMFYEIKTDSSELHSVQIYLEQKGVQIKNAQLTMFPQNMLNIDNLEKATQAIKFIDALEDNDDVQKVYTNLNISEEIMQQLPS